MLARWFFLLFSNLMVAPVSTGLLLVLLGHCRPLWDVDVPLHDQLYRGDPRGNFLVNVGLIQHKDTVGLLVSLLGIYGYSSTGLI
jgi:hypothetical protein